MSTRTILIAAAIWFAIAILAVANGAFREQILIPQLGKLVALPLSGISLSLLVLVVTGLTVHLFGTQTAETFFMIGLQWVLMTLTFEFLFGHYVVGKSWAELLKAFQFWKGDLFTLVLIVSLVAPWLMAKWRGILH